ncbi:MAG: S-methyl-5'-thioadenosine phosphorylase [Desulfuromonadaceae bacterium]|nr:S-methyl-5'-thioadenosine phosphorylase [Desulfuromonadaceae bacterium]
MSVPVIGVIGGSGLYQLEGLQDIEEVRLQTPFGEPSDAYITGTLGEVKLVFLPRHGRAHSYLPSEVPYRANIYGMKMLGVERIISISAVGSMKEEIVPGHIVLPDQFIDRTSGKRENTFFGGGIVGHVQFANPVCNELCNSLTVAAKQAGATLHKGGTYICIEGPTFSTRAESNLYRSWGVDVIGMTNLPEARLAREAEICYATVALATDYDCWNQAHDDVSVEAVIAVMRANIEMAKKIIAATAREISASRSCSCSQAAQHCVMTDPAQLNHATREKLDLIIGKYFKG